MKAIKVWEVLSWDPTGKFTEGKDHVWFIFVSTAWSLNHWTIREDPVIHSIRSFSNLSIISIFVTALNNFLPIICAKFCPISDLGSPFPSHSQDREAVILLLCPLYKHLFSLRRSPDIIQLVIHYLFSQKSTSQMRGAQITQRSMAFRSDSFGAGVVPYEEDFILHGTHLEAVKLQSFSLEELL